MKLYNDIIRTVATYRLLSILQYVQAKTAQLIEVMARRYNPSYNPLYRY